MYNVIRTGNEIGEIARAKRNGLYDPEHDAAIVKTFDRREDAQVYADALTSMWTPCELKEFKKEYRVVDNKQSF